MNVNRIFLDQFEPHFVRINQELEKLITSSVVLVNAISSHSLLGYGKRVRPLLFVLSGQLCGYRGDDIYHLSTMFECIHTGSLLHDDVLDNAETRRNKPAAREVWGNQASVLGGDFLYTKAIELAITTEKFKFIRLLNKMSRDMVEGQLLELANTGNWDLSKEDYMRIIIAKTGVLMSAACACGALLAGAGDEEVENLNGFGLNLGIAFQLIDDALDYTSCEEVFGKPVGKDLKEGKVTLPLIYALPELKKADVQRFKALFENHTATDRDYAEIISLVRNRHTIESIRSEAKDYMAKAAGFLNAFPDSSTKQDLLTLNAYLSERRF